jgi:hypothetical protein
LAGTSMRATAKPACRIVGAEHVAPAPQLQVLLGDAEAVPLSRA